MREWRRFRERSLQSRSPIGYDEWFQGEVAQAWPARLGQITGLRILNKAKVGAGIDWVARQTLSDISSEISAGMDPSDIIVLIQPPTEQRLQLHTAAGWTSWQLNDQGMVPQSMHEWFVINETVTSLLTRWLISLTGLCSTLSCLRVRVVLVDAGIPSMPVLVSHDEGLGVLRQTYHAVCGHLWHPRSMEDHSKLLAKPRCPDLHWTREVHQLLAEDLAGVIT